jgi:hypothetical protein
MPDQSVQEEPMNKYEMVTDPPRRQERVVECLP